ncbi:MAG: type II secretion system protein GspG, partial [Sphingobacteriales bacterium]
QNISQAKTETAKAHMASLKTALQSYRLDNLTYPTTEQGLQALVTKPASEPVPRKWRADGYMERIPMDPWDRPYIYLMPGGSHPFDIVTLGADGQPGGKDEDADIGYWDEPVLVAMAPLSDPVSAISAEDAGSFSKTNAAESLQRLPGVAVRKSYSVPSASQQIDPTQQTQTGPGKPSWHHSTVYLSWSGPVTAEQTTNLYWVPPWINRPGYFIAAFLPWVLALALWQASGLMRINLTSKPFGRALGVLVLLSCSTSLLLQAPDALAEDVSAKSSESQSLRTQAIEPSPTLLNELKTRLLAPPLCLPDCVAIESVNLQAKDDTLRLELVIHALAPSIYTLPVNQTSWWPQAALINNERASVRQTGAELEVALLPGRQTLVLLGNLTGRTNLALAFGVPINNLKTDISGWRLSGEPTPASSSTNLQLSRAQGASVHADKRLTPAPMAPFVRIQRRLQLGLEWAVETEVTRIAPATGSIHLNVPLI